MGIGENIRAAREKRNWNQNRLAERAGISQTHLSQIERGAIELPHMDTLEAILNALNRNTDRLMKRLLRDVGTDKFLELAGFS